MLKAWANNIKDTTLGLRVCIKLITQQMKLVLIGGNVRTPNLWGSLDIIDDKVMDLSSI